MGNYHRSFFKADPHILLDKRLSHQTWLVYCHQELLAGHTRIAKAPIERISDTLAVTLKSVQECMDSLAECHPDYLLSDDLETNQELAAPPKPWIKLYSFFVPTPFPTWPKRV